MIQEDGIISIIQQIFDSQVIPESHKIKYVEYIEEHGLTEKMLEELEKVFKQEEEQLSMSKRDQQQLVGRLQEMIQEEQAESDELQARLLAAYEEAGERDLHEFEHELGNYEQSIENTFEMLQGQMETSEIDALRAQIASGNNE